MCIDIDVSTRLKCDILRRNRLFCRKLIIKIMQKIEAKKNLKKVLTMIKRIWYYKKALEREEKRERKDLEN